MKKFAKKKNKKLSLIELKANVSLTKGIHKLIKNRCMQSLAQGIENGEIPLSSDFHKSAWDYENPYRNLDAGTTDPYL